MDDLVSVNDLASFLRVDPFEGKDAEAAVAAVRSASGIVRRYCRQDLSYVKDDTIELRGAFSADLQLPQRPIVDVTAITVNGRALVATNYRWTPDAKLIWAGVNAVNGGAAIEPASSWGGPAATVTVTYSHGFREIPAEIAAVVLQVAARQFNNPQGKTSTSASGYSQSLPGVFPLELSRAEKDVLNPFRKRTR